MPDTRHPACEGKARFDCPCWVRGARDEAAARRTRPATRELTDYIRALGEADPGITAAQMAVRVYEVFAGGKR